MKFSLCMGITLLASQMAVARQSTETALTVRAIVIEGNLTTKDFVILREMKLKPGETISQEALEHDQSRIYSLQLFNKVELEVRPEGSEAVVLVRVDERWYLFPFPVFGIRYRDFNKLYYGAGVVHQNFRGRNEKIFFSFAFGYDRWVNLFYQNPKLTDDDDIFLGIESRYSEIQSLSVETDVYDQTNLKLGVTLGKRLGLYQSVQGWVNYDMWKVSEPEVGRTVSADGRDAFMSVGGSYAIDTRDVREYPLQGFSFVLFGSKFGFGESPVNFFRYGFDTRHHTLLNEDISLGGRLFTNLSGGGVIPKYQRAYFGYNERIRGYFRTEREGESILGASTELRIPLLKPRYYQLPFEFIPQFSTLRYGLYVGVFVDGGTIWYRHQKFFDRRWYTGVGAGLHFLLPYSLILRTEYAFNNEGRGEFIFDLGTSF